jgi:large subunit ribosomal protein L6e
MVSGSRNPELARGITKYGRAQMFHKSGKFKFVTKGGPKAAPKAKKESGSRFYEADDVSYPLASRKSVQHATKLRSSITPGTVLIVLTGRFRGKRVVFLKQLEKSGLLLVSGEYRECIAITGTNWGLLD